MNRHALRLLLLAGSTAILANGCSKNNDKIISPGITYKQTDRMAIPAINTALIPAAMKDAFNAGSPATDVANSRATAQATIVALRAAVADSLPPEDSPGLTPATVASVVIPDIVTIDFSQPVQFPNGRRLADDVIDADLSLVLNRGDVLGGGPGVPDDVNANDVAFSGTFPYLATPH